MKYPNRIFFTGVPGSRWSGIAQVLEEQLNLNTSDRDPSKEYSHHAFSGHKGAYFGVGMEYEAYLDNPEYLDRPWKDEGGTRLIKSHDWAHVLDQIKEKYSTDWIMLVYRPDTVSLAWWHEAGGFSIKYPDYSSYRNSTKMHAEIAEQNRCILEFAHKHDCTWYHFNTKFFKEVFDVSNIDHVKFDTFHDCLVTIVKV